jgi:Zn-dependent protease with chaperone function
MIHAAALLIVGLGAPYALQRLGSRTRPELVIAANLAGLVLVWLALIDLMGLWMLPDHGVLGLCRVAFERSHDLVDVRGAGLLPAVGVALGGRALWSIAQTCRSVRRARHRIAASGRPLPGGLIVATLGTVACTIGFVRPRIVVDHARFAALSAPQQRAVIAHERGHVRGWHALIDLAARGLAAGLAPWPGARLAYGEIRRHLEAAADDRAARYTSRRDVAAAIVEAATSPPAVALGAGGWAVWRVDRLLSPHPPRAWHAVAASGIVGLTAAVVIQLSGHAATGIHLLSALLPCCLS